ncbi:MAG: hypothetical protein J6K73_09060 [Clostridia bacterium]|nr:hypothetical protein [Clostridia bacterium]
MKKKDFLFLLLTTVAGLMFALGMCMCLVPEWNLFKPGVVVTGLGLLALMVVALAAWIRAGKPVAKINWALTGKIAYGVVSALVLGAGMSMNLVFENLLLPGMIVGVVGIVMLLCLIPLCKGLKD